MSTDSELRDSIERTKQAFRSVHEEPPPAPKRDEPPPAPRREEPPQQPAARPSAALHPFFRGLLEVLPEPGAEWPQSEREQWLETARNIFSLVFTESEQRDSRSASGGPTMPSQFERRVA